MTTVSIVVPSMKGREDLLDQALEAHTEHTEGYDCEVILPYNEPGAGHAWQKGAEHSTGDYIMLSADDIIAKTDYLPQMIDIVDQGGVPAALVYENDDMPRAFENAHSNVTYDDDPSNMVYYPAIPFCSREQWESIGPMIPCHYGTDPWFGYRAKASGYPVVAAEKAIFKHLVGESPKPADYEGDWTQRDREVFGNNIALPAYISGVLPPDQEHPLLGTEEGLKLAREWYKVNVG